MAAFIILDENTENNKVFKCNMVLKDSTESARIIYKNLG
jgi:hypothetical protein